MNMFLFLSQLPSWYSLLALLFPSQYYPKCPLLRVPETKVPQQDPKQPKRERINMRQMMKNSLEVNFSLHIIVAFDLEKNLSNANIVGNLSTRAVPCMHTNLLT